jgi:23S rRNA pseudouridine1911/1915/1917 synthase
MQRPAPTALPDVLPEEGDGAQPDVPPAIEDEALPEPGDAAPGEEAFERREAVLDAQAHGQRLDKVLVALAPEFSRSHLQRLLAQGHVRLDGRPAGAASQRVRAGQALALELVPTDESRAFVPQPMALAIVHEDEHLLVLDKPAGLVVHPAPGHWQHTLLNGLLAHHAGAAELPRAGIVHRLDKDTSGLMVVGKTLAAVTALVRDIAARRVHRRYLAIAHGLVQPPRQAIEAPIARDPRSRLRMAVVAGGKPARTDVERLARRAGRDAAGAAAADDLGDPGDPGGGAALSPLSCTLHTGRTHQIRVHLAWRGHPLVADALYGGAPALGLQRQALHATELRLAHPASGAAMGWRRAPPPDFAAAWAALGAPEGA